VLKINKDVNGQSKNVGININVKLRIRKRKKKSFKKEGSSRD
jgi:hypothetical protein